MPAYLRLSLVFLLALVQIPIVEVLAQDQSAYSTSKKNMVASVNPLATQAGLDVLADGGNAVDAAIATAFMLGVVDTYNSGIGGGCFILIRTAEGEIIAIDGREMAPAAADRDMYLREGKPDPLLSQIGPLAVGVPGALKAYHEAASEFGKLEFSRLMEPAIATAENGFSISNTYAGRLKSAHQWLTKFPGSKQALTHDGEALSAGQKLVQPDLANTYRSISEQGIEYFYQGEFAKQVGNWMKENGGIITEADFANYITQRREPILTTYRDLEIIGFPPPSSGGVHVAQILNIVEHFEIAKLHQDNPGSAKHVVAEAMKLAFADRAHWLGDPDFAKVPRGLIDKTYAKELAARINLSKSTTIEKHGMPPLHDSDFFKQKHTTHVAAADSQGNWVAITTTLNTSFGSKVIVPGTGVMLNNQMDDFSAAPGTPNSYGLIGTEANSIQPGKRPLSSMSPTIILQDGQPVMTIGAAGGPRIITQAVLGIIRTFDLEMDLPTALSNPRFHHQWAPDRLSMENGTPAEQVEYLRGLGHDVQLSGNAGTCQAIYFDRQAKLFHGMSDPRVEGSSGGNQ